MAVDWELWKKRLEVPKDDNAFYENDSLTNRDIIPIPPERRTWSAIAYATYWVIEGVSISGYTTGSTLMGFGLSAKQSIAIAVAAGVLYGILAAVMGWIGSHQHIGFPLFARVMYGINGAAFGIVMRIITGIIWWGVQAYYGGQAIRVCIGAMSPSFLNWDSFHNANGITSANLVGLVIYCVIMVPCLRIPPEKLQFYFRVVTFITVGAFFGILGYTVHKAQGVGKMFSEGSTTFTNSGDLAWGCVKGIFSVLGSTSTGCLGQSDFTRYAKNKRSPVASQIIGAPLALTFASVISVISTSAAKELTGEVIWNPVTLLGTIQQLESNSSAARAAVFFGSFAFVLQQMAINLLLNTLSSSMDMVGLLPKYINIRRGSFIVMCVGILIWPWKILSSAQAVVIFGTGWGIFASPQTGILIAKYFIVYRRKVLLKDLYIRSPESIYWFYGGIDWRSIAAFVVGMAFLIPGLVADVDSKDIGFWTYIYRMSFAWGLILSGATVVVLHYLFPQKFVNPRSKVDDVYTDDGVALEIYESNPPSVESIEIMIKTKNENSSGVDFS